MNNKMNEQYIDEMLRTGTEFFGVFNDPTEIASSWENYEKISLLYSSAYKFKTDAHGKLLGWTVVIPTSRELANDFIERRITEKELLEKTDTSTAQNALYLFVAFIVPEYRKKGYAKNMFLEQIKEAAGDKLKEVLLFAWPVTEEGGKTMDAIERNLGVEILRRKGAEKVDK
ncbi:hypothetical protein A2524_02660 [Candidatus Wolfebacteria bacterium RIFOXYD12_FULL_48_21]|uniref:N-acetyltransferase domain-containing protein n=1 Tax=Candidatus Wolfebacteria bacterium RIFOXYD1_FULL_48_65 TaxID=1802561 RepID=A0A1F8E426_9BACT|nr:MAG: hypothetical protein A2524_02660 [Candidatus Wolfebacteria bacterium RIFOXYD12_FULL_48_21]OGM95417.1 MAG: hypothetical protein A2610_00870 [Candidatus Wolfebacteria bacterium RIFOXYD1_FULL_48_65]